MNFREMWNIFKHNNICMMRVPKGEETDKQKKQLNK